MIEVPDGHLAVVLTWAGDRAVLTLRGDADHYSCAKLAGVLDRLLSQGTLFIDLDCHDLDFADAAWLHIVSAAVAKVGPVGGQVTVIDPTPVMLRLLRGASKVGLAIRT